MVTECTSCAKLPPPPIPPCLGGRAAGRGGGGAPPASSSPIPLPESSDIGSNIEKKEMNRMLSCHGDRDRDRDRLGLPHTFALIVLRLKESLRACSLYHNEKILKGRSM